MVFTAALLAGLCAPAWAVPERAAGERDIDVAAPAEAPAAPSAGKTPASVEEDAFGDFDDFGEFEGEGGAPKRVFDPLRGYNRVMFRVNDKLYFWVLKPVAQGYGYVMPQFARTAFGKAFHNLAFPLRFVNQLLQLKLKIAGKELGRFVVNSTVGVGGLWDPAGRWLAWHAQDEDFGQTLGRYGVGDGFPVVLPILGQTNLRDAVARVPNFLLNPLWYVADTQTNLMVGAGEQFNFASLHLGEYESIKKDALDPYTFIRDAYKQSRDKKIKE